MNIVGVQTSQWPMTAMGQIETQKCRVSCKWTMWGIYAAHAPTTCDYIQNVYMLYFTTENVHG